MEPEDLTKEAQEILVKAFKAGKGNIRSVETGEIISILIDGKKLNDNNDEQHLETFNKLIKLRLIEKKQLEGNSYQLTEEGHKLAE